jgi:hypothetical protein
VQPGARGPRVSFFLRSFESLLVSFVVQTSNAHELHLAAAVCRGRTREAASSRAGVRSVRPDPFFVGIDIRREYATQITQSTVRLVRLSVQVASRFSNSCFLNSASLLSFYVSLRGLVDVLRGSLDLSDGEEKRA